MGQLACIGFPHADWSILSDLVPVCAIALPICICELENMKHGKKIAKEGNSMEKSIVIIGVINSG